MDRISDITRKESYRIEQRNWKISHLSNQPILDGNNKSVHVGNGISTHMGGLIYKCQYSTLTGKELAPTVLRDEYGIKPINVFLLNDLQKIIGKVATNRDIFESASNIVEARIKNAFAISVKFLPPPNWGNENDIYVGDRGDIFERKNHEWKYLNSFPLATYTNEDYFGDEITNSINIKHSDVLPTTNIGWIVWQVITSGTDKGKVWFSFDEDKWVDIKLNVLGDRPLTTIIRFSDEIPDAPREASYAIYKQLDDNFEDELLKIVDTLDDLIPKDPLVAKIVIKEKIEAMASQKQKDIMGIKGESAIMLMPSCVEEADALQELAALRRQASIRIDATSYISEMEMIVDTFEKSINDIKVLNVPDWDWVSGGGFTQAPESDPAIIGWDATKFPMTLSITSDVTKYGNVGIDTTINNEIINSNSLFQIPTVPDVNNQVQLTDNTGGNLAFGIYKLKIFAVNNCGPGRLNVDIEHPEQKISDPAFATAGVQDSTWDIVDGVVSPLAKGIAFEANFATNAVILSESIPVVLKARYDISLTAEKTRGSRLFAGCVQFLQRDGTPITATTYGLDKYAYPNGWIAVGDYFFWNDGITTKQTYTFTIGRGTDSIGRVPRGAKSMKVGIAILPDQTVSDVCKITLDNLSVDELIWYEPPIGS